MPRRDRISRLIGFNRYTVEKFWLHRGWAVVWLKRKTVSFRCPKCGKRYPVYHDRKDRHLRDLDLGRLKTLLVVKRHRINCTRCGRQKERFPFARPDARATKRFEAHLFRLTRDMSVKAAARLMRTDWRTVKDSEVRHIRGLLRKRDLDGVTHLGIDEVAEHKGQRYLTLVTDLLKRRVIWVGKNRDRTTLKRFFRWFGERRVRQLRVVVIDMHAPYEVEVAASVPGAVIVYDRFHVMKILNHAVDLVRRRVQNQMTPPERRAIKNKRYVILKSNENLSRRDRVRLKELLAVNEEISTSYILKEDFRGWFDQQSPALARAYLRDWIEKVRESGIPELLKFADLLRQRRRGLRNYFLHRVTNSLSEGFNNVVKTIKKVAYGFHDSDYFRLKILRMCGGLEIEDVDY
jgi:transposase